ncbi:uncharacterized protein [Argopecten irradians]|uniref:uncharacterized protein n=1 Tax=Argopecten irradians TaxID=31199 RepID=UPI003724AA99
MTFSRPDSKHAGCPRGPLHIVKRETMKFGEEERQEFESFQQNRHKDVLVIRKPQVFDEGIRKTKQPIKDVIAPVPSKSNRGKPTELTLKRKAVEDVVVELECAPVRKPTKPKAVYNKFRKVESTATSVSGSTVPPADLAITLDSEELEEYAVSETSANVRYEPTKILSKIDTKLATIAVNQSQRVMLNVGGTHFETCPNTLLTEPTSVLARMMDDRGKTVQPYNKESVFTYFLDRDPKHYRTILNYLRNPNSELLLPVTRFHLKELLAECDYLEIDTLGDAVKQQLEEM